MKIATLPQILLASTLAAVTLFNSQFAQAQLPPIVDNAPTNSLAPTQNNSGGDGNSGANSGGNSGGGSEQIVAAAATLKVSCQDLTTVVKKGDRQATMVSWSYAGFGKEFSPEKRCQMVSERLQQVADQNGGTFKDLQLASGTINSQPVICALQSNAKKCTTQNLLFTLKPENARNPEAVIQKIFTFAQDGTGTLNESASTTPLKADLNLGNWEQKVFPGSPMKTGTAKQSTPIKRNNANRGF
jgi:Circadian oscillating protein COP23